MIDNFVSLELQNHTNIYYQICEFASQLKTLRMLTFGTELTYPSPAPQFSGKRPASQERRKNLSESRRKLLAKC